MPETNHREAFEDFADEAEDELGNSLRKLVLFGSTAKGNEEEESDVDVFAVVDSKSEREKLHKLAFEKEIEHDVIISLIVRDEENFQRNKENSFLKEVMETGEVRV